MKKLLFVAAATMLALSSCSDNEIFNSVEKSKTPIALNVYSQSQTRAVTETTLTTLQGGFKFVALNGTTEMINSTVTFADGKWSYGTTAVYWPTDDASSITFYGLYPTTNTLDAANDKATVTVDGSTDAVIAYSSKSLSQTTGGSVNLSFSHILAQVLVSAKGDNADFDYNVTSVVLNADNAIDYKYSTAATTAAATSAKTNFTYISAEGIPAPYSATAYTALSDDNVLALAALPVTLTITYTVSSQAAGDQTLTKTATFTPVAGKKNRINLTLPNSRTAMSFTVDTVAGWDTTENAQDVTAN